MDTLLRKEGFHQYLMFRTSHNDMDGFAFNMLTRYQGEGLLSMELQGRDGELYICYEISGGISLTQAFQDKEMDRAFLQALFESFLQCCEELEEYLLSVEGLVLRPEQIYYLPGKNQLRFCYLPENPESFAQALLALVEFCMQRIKQGDSESLLFIHGLYRLILEEGQENEIKEYLTGFLSDTKPVAPCSKEDQLEPEVIPVENHRSSALSWQLYGGLALLCLILTVVFSVRFFAITHHDVDMKVCIIFAVVMFVFFYSMKKCKQADIVRQASLHMPDGSDTLLIQEVEEAPQPLIEFRRQSGEEATNFDETRVLNGPCAEKNIWELESIQADGSDILLSRIPGILGRKSGEVDYPLSDERVSRRHLLIFQSGEEIYAEDLSSTNGTYLNGERLTAGIPVRLAPEDRIVIGHLEYRVKHNGQRGL